MKVRDTPYLERTEFIYLFFIYRSIKGYKTKANRYKRWNIEVELIRHTKLVTVVEISSEYFHKYCA
jgi:hypothetical protein